MVRLESARRTPPVTVRARPLPKSHPMTDQTVYEYCFDCDEFVPADDPHDCTIRGYE